MEREKWSSTNRTDYRASKVPQKLHSLIVSEANTGTLFRDSERARRVLPSVDIQVTCTRAKGVAALSVLRRFILTAGGRTNGQGSRKLWIKHGGERHLREGESLVLLEDGESNRVLLTGNCSSMTLIRLLYSVVGLYWWEAFKVC